MIEYRKFITRQMLRDEPGKLFVFGDNFQQRGFGGQAKEMRGEPNAVGIPTKIAPGMKEEDFLCDNDYRAWFIMTGPIFDKLYDANAVIVWPEDGIGTGLAQLERRAPKLWEILEIFKGILEAKELTLTNEEED